MPKRTSMFVSAQHAAGVVRDLLNVVREVNEWRHERDAFVAMDDHDESAAPLRVQKPKG